jgi:hypothetical protein
MTQETENKNKQLVGNAIMFGFACLVIGYLLGHSESSRSKKKMVVTHTGELEEIMEEKE